MSVRQKAGLNRSILDQCWGEFERQLAYKLERAGGELWQAPARHSSNECESCGHTHLENRESQAVFVCKACGHSRHADTNAANVILARVQRGKSQLVTPSSEPSGGTPGRRSRMARNACEDPTVLKNPERREHSRKRTEQGARAPQAPATSTSLAA